MLDASNLLALSWMTFGGPCTGVLCRRGKRVVAGPCHWVFRTEPYSVQSDPGPNLLKTSWLEMCCFDVFCLVRPTDQHSVTSELSKNTGGFPVCSSISETFRDVSVTPRVGGGAGKGGVGVVGVVKSPSSSKMRLCL